jgi:hypothetical protein
MISLYVAEIACIWKTLAHIVKKRERVVYPAGQKSLNTATYRKR